MAARLFFYTSVLTPAIMAPSKIQRHTTKQSIQYHNANNIISRTVRSESPGLFDVLKKRVKNETGAVHRAGKT